MLYGCVVVRRVILLGFIHVECMYNACNNMVWCRALY